MKASAVVTTYNQASRFGVGLRHASGPWCRKEGYGSEHGLRCLCVECGDKDGRECWGTYWQCLDSIKVVRVVRYRYADPESAPRVAMKS